MGFPPSALTCPTDCMPASRNALGVLLGHIFWFGFTWRVNFCARHGSTLQSKMQKRTNKGRPPGPISGIWDVGWGGAGHLTVPAQPTLPPPPPKAWGMQEDCQGMRPHCSQTRAKRGLCVQWVRAGRPRHCCCNCSSAHPLERQQLAPIQCPNFTRKHGHVYTDTTAIQNTAINSMQDTAGVAGCFATNSRENGSSCDSRMYAHSGFCPLSLELLYAH